MNLKSKSVCVIDDGWFFPICIHLAKHFGKVFFWNDTVSKSPTINKLLIGDGYNQVIRLDEFWPHLNEIDVFVFPDNGYAQLQKHLEKMGKLVWGSREGDELELKREKLRLIQKELKMDVPEYKMYRGLSSLRDHLKDAGHCFIKISRWRGNTETFEHHNYELSKGYLDKLAVSFGPAAEFVRFMVEQPIDTDIELGTDSFCINGRFPNKAVMGIEKKDTAYIGALLNYDDLPEQVQAVNEKLIDDFTVYQYRNFFSTEIRVKDDKNYLIDFTARLGFPSGNSQLLLYKNLGEIIWWGAQGRMIDIEPAAKFAIEVAIHHRDDPDIWRQIIVPDEILDRVNLVTPFRVSGTLYSIPVLPHPCNIIGSVCGLGDTIEEALEDVMKLADELKDNHVEINTHALADMLIEAKKMEERGMPMSNNGVPDPDTVLEKVDN